MFEVAFVALIVATVARARKEGMSWIEIWAFPSQWFNWTFAGRKFRETFSAFVGYQVREGAYPQRIWHILCIVIDTALRPRERHHCAETLHRLEKRIRNEHRRHTGN